MYKLAGVNHAEIQNIAKEAYRREDSMEQYRFDLVSLGLVILVLNSWGLVNTRDSWIHTYLLVIFYA